MDKYLNIFNLIPRVEAISGKVEVYISKPSVMWIVIGCLILFSFFVIILLTRYLVFVQRSLKEQKSIAKPPPEKVEWLKERIEKKVHITKIKPISFIIWTFQGLFLLSILVLPFYLPLIRDHLSRNFRLFAIFFVVMMVIFVVGMLYEVNYGLVRRWTVKNWFRTLKKLFLESLTSILQPQEKIWYVAFQRSNISLWKVLTTFSEPEKLYNDAGWGKVCVVTSK